MSQEIEIKGKSLKVSLVVVAGILFSALCLMGSRVLDHEKKLTSIEVNMEYMKNAQHRIEDKLDRVIEGR